MKELTKLIASIAAMIAAVSLAQIAWKGLTVHSGLDRNIDVWHHTGGTYRLHFFNDY